MRAQEFITERKKRSKKTRGYGGYFFPGYGFYGSDAGEGGGDGGGGGGESKNLGMAEGFPQPGPSSGAPKKFGSDAKIQTRQMTVKDIISSVPGVPYYNNVVDDWDAKDYSWGVTKKVIEYATYLKDHPESLAKLPPAIVLNGKFEDGAHRVSAIWLLQQRMDPKNPLWANAKLNVQFVKQGVAEGKIRLYTDPDYFGAEVDDYQASGPVQNIPVDLLVGFEPDSKMQQPESRANVEKIIAGIKRGDDIPPILVREYKDGYQILDGHHRFRAYKLLGVKSIPAQVVPDSDIEEISKQGVAENFADGKVKGKSRPGRVKRSGASCDGSVTDLRARAKKASGERAKMYHWCANMKSGRKKTNEVTVGVLTLGEFTVNLDDHALDRAQERRIKSTDIDTVLKKIKLPRVIKKIMAIDLGSRFYVLDHSSNVALGFRRIGDKKLVLKTVYPGRPMDHNIATIITI